MIKSFGTTRPVIAQSSWISESALVMGNVEIGENCGVFPGAVIRGDFTKITVGNNTVIEDNVVVHSGSPLVLGSNVIVGHGAVIHCHSVGNNSLIANNATVLDNAVVGNFCIIGAGCVVSPGMEIPDYSLVFGVPGKISGRVKDRQMQRLERGNESYKKMFAEYKRHKI
jgi:carbonic anhydrase/acetyltransferase-like protein (isoleucine patch superfamily)